MIQVGDTVYAGATGRVHWTVETIEDRIAPLGVVLVSGMTGRVRRESYENLIPFKGQSE